MALSIIMHVQILLLMHKRGLTKGNVFFLCVNTGIKRTMPLRQRRKITITLPDSVCQDNQALAPMF